MDPFKIFIGGIAPINRVNVDTDQIIPKQFLKRVERTGFGKFLFNDWRYNEDGSENQDFILNKDIYKDASILVSGRNFGSGSSREHAPWALQDFGFKCIIAPSFADIFYSNCFQNGILPIILPESIVTEIMTRSENNPNYQMTIDLEEQKIWDTDEDIVTNFDVEPFRKYCMLNGLDDIGLTLEFENNISEFENNRSIYGGII